MRFDIDNCNGACQRLSGAREVQYLVAMILQLLGFVPVGVYKYLRTSFFSETNLLMYRDGIAFGSGEHQSRTVTRLGELELTKTPKDLWVSVLKL